jgi:hypothetical protein
VADNRASTFCSVGCPTPLDLRIVIGANEPKKCVLSAICPSGEHPI